MANSLLVGGMITSGLFFVAYLLIPGYAALVAHAALFFIAMVSFPFTVRCMIIKSSDSPLSPKTRRQILTSLLIFSCFVLQARFLVSKGVSLQPYGFLYGLNAVLVLPATALFLIGMSENMREMLERAGSGVAMCGFILGAAAFTLDFLFLKTAFQLFATASGLFVAGVVLQAAFILYHTAKGDIHMPVEPGIKPGPQVRVFAIALLSFLCAVILRWGWGGPCSAFTGRGVFLLVAQAVTLRALSRCKPGGPDNDR